MKTTELTSSVDKFFEPKKAGDAVYGKYMGSEKIGKNDVAMFKNGVGQMGVNIYKTLEIPVSKMEEGGYYLIIFEGIASPKNGDNDYFQFKVLQPEPEDQEDKDLLNEYYKMGTLNTEEANSENGKDDDVPF